MAAVLTKISSAVLGPDMKVVVYTCALDSSYPTGGEVIDISGDFKRAHAVLVGANDTAADNNYKFQVIHNPGADISASNVIVQAHWTGATVSDVLADVTNATDLSAIGKLQIVVIGR